MVPVGVSRSRCDEHAGSREDATIPAMEDAGGNGGPKQVVDESLLDAIAAMTPWERIRHNDRMLRTLRLLGGRPKNDERAGGHG